MSFLEKVEQTIKSYGLVNQGDNVLIAFSGGPDSTALLLAMHALSSRLSTKLTAVYVNHQIRPKAARKEERFCTELCLKLGIEFLLQRVNVPEMAKRMKLGLEEAGREARYKLLAEVAETTGCSKVALGHQRDDRVETVLFRILRGTGMTGLRGILPSRGHFIRPLFEVSKQEIIDFLNQRRQEYCIDRSNEDQSFKRNYIRRELLPKIRKDFNPAVDRALLNLAETATEDENFLESLVEKEAALRIIRSPGGKCIVRINNLGKKSVWLRRRLLRRCLIETSVDKMSSDKEVIDRLLFILNSRKGKASLPNHRQAEVVGNELVVSPNGRLRFHHKIDHVKGCLIKKLGYNVSVRVMYRGDFRLEKSPRSLTVFLDRDKVVGMLTVRNIEAGDRFRPLGLRGTKKVGDYLTDRKVPPVFRDEIPLVVDEEKIVWLVGHEIDERVKIDNKTKEVLRVEFTEGH